MKFELIAIEDNTAYISEIKKIEETKAKILQETANELETLSRENLMKIFTVLKSYYEDYCKIEGYKMPSNHALTSHCYESELRAIADKLIFYRVRGNEYQAVLTAIFSSDKIIILCRQHSNIVTIFSISQTVFFRRLCCFENIVKHIDSLIQCV